MRGYSKIARSRVSPSSSCADLGCCDVSRLCVRALLSLCLCVPPGPPSVPIVSTPS